jgi:DNA-binding MarR family transcriptional regulator
MDSLEDVKMAAEFGILVSLLYRDSIADMSTTLAGTGVGAGQHALLLVIAEDEGCRQEDLVQTLHLDKAHIARGVERLERAGHLRRSADEQDRRAKRLWLTDAGRAVLPKIASAIDGWNERVLGKLSAEERETLVSLLRRVGRPLW